MTEMTAKQIAATKGISESTARKQAEKAGLLRGRGTTTSTRIRPDGRHKGYWVHNTARTWIVTEAFLATK
jgi:hypothetical protein